MSWQEDRVTKLFMEIMRQDEELSLGDTSLDDPNWALKQAYISGQKRMLRKLEKLTNG